MSRHGVFPTIFEDKLSHTHDENLRDEAGGIKSNFREHESKINSIHGKYDLEHFAKIHKHLLQDISTLVGYVRGVSYS